MNVGQLTTGTARSISGVRSQEMETLPVRAPTSQNGAMPRRSFASS